MGIAYRLSQLRANLTAGPLDETARREIAHVLGAAEQKMFYQFTFADQRHSYRVLRTLRDASYNHPDLLAAALLHDVGKVRCPLSIWDRTVIVIVGKLWPERATSWGQGALDSWRRPFVARALHPAWGAQMAHEAGSRPAVIELIARHQEKLGRIETETEQLLATLQWADDQS